jgi:hypothetical protein
MSEVIGIIYSPGFGAGWSTWGDAAQATDQELAKAIYDELPYEEIEKIAERNWPEAYKGGLKDCTVEWVEAGTRFAVEEYDGNESLRFAHDGDYWNVV